MPPDKSHYAPITQDEFDAILRTNRTFQGRLFSAAVTLDDADCTDACFTRCRFDGLSARGTNFSGAQLTDCRLGQVRFASCCFVEARLANSQFFDIDTKKGCVFAFCEMRAVELIDCNFAENSFERCDLHAVQATGCSLRSARFHGCHFDRAISKKLVLTKARFDNCNLSYADMSKLSLRGCEIVSCKLLETLFWDTDLTKAVLRDSIVERAEWDRAKLSGADLQGASIAGLNLAVLADYAGLIVSQSQQHEILREIGVDVRPD